MNRHRRKLFSWTVITGLIFNLISPLFLLPWQQVWACFGSWDCGGNAYCAGAGSYPDHPGSCASYGERGNNDRTTSEIAQDYINNGGNPAEVVTRTADFQGALSNNNAAAAAAAAQQLAAAEAQRIAAEQAAAANAAAAAAAAKAADDKAKVEAQRLAQEAAERSARAAANAAAAAAAMTAINAAVPAGTPAAGATAPTAAIPASAAGASCGSSAHNVCSPNSDGNWYKCVNGSWQKYDDCKPAGAINCVSGCAGANGCMPEGTPAVYNGVEKVCRGGRWDEPIPQDPNPEEAMETWLATEDVTSGIRGPSSPIVVNSPAEKPPVIMPVVVPQSPDQPVSKPEPISSNIQRCEEKGWTWANNTCINPGLAAPATQTYPDESRRYSGLIPPTHTPIPTVKFSVPVAADREDRIIEQSPFSEIALPTNRPGGTSTFSPGDADVKNSGSGNIRYESYCDGKTLVTKTRQAAPKSGVANEQVSSQVCAWGCDGGACRPPTGQEVVSYRRDVVDNAIDAAKVRCVRSGQTNCSTSAVYEDAMQNVDAREPSQVQAAIISNTASQLSAGDKKALIDQEFQNLYQQARISQQNSLGSGGWGSGLFGDTELTDAEKADLRRRAAENVDLILASGNIDAGGGNILDANSSDWDQIGGVSGDRAQEIIDQQKDIKGKFIAKTIFCSTNDEFQQQHLFDCGGLQLLDQDFLRSAWSGLIAGKSEQKIWDQGMVFGDARSAAFQVREYNDNVAPECGVYAAQRELTAEETDCLTGQTVAALYKWDTVDEQNQVNAALNVTSAALGFAGGAVGAGIKATGLVGKAGVLALRSGVVSDLVLVPAFAETMTAGDRAEADVLTALAEADGISDDQRAMRQARAETAQASADTAYTENVISSIVAVTAMNLGGEALGSVARRAIGDTPLGRLLLGDVVDEAVERQAASAVADETNRVIVGEDGTVWNVKPEAVNPRTALQEGELLIISPGERNARAATAAELVNLPEESLVWHRSPDGDEVLHIADSRGDLHVVEPRQRTGQAGGAAGPRAVSAVDIEGVADRVVTTEDVVSAARDTRAVLRGETDVLGEQAVVAGVNVPAGAEVGEAVAAARTAIAGRQGIGGIADRVADTVATIGYNAAGIVDRAGTAVNSALAEEGAVGRAIAGMEQPITNVGRRLETAVDGAVRSAGEAFDAAKVRIAGQGVPAGETIVDLDSVDRYSVKLNDFKGKTVVLKPGDIVIKDGSHFLIPESPLQIYGRQGDNIFYRVYYDGIPGPVEELAAGGISANIAGDKQIAVVFKPFSQDSVSPADFDQDSSIYKFLYHPESITYVKNVSQAENEALVNPGGLGYFIGSDEVKLGKNAEGKFVRLRPGDQVIHYGNVKTIPDPKANPSLDLFWQVLDQDVNEWSFPRRLTDDGILVGISDNQKVIRIGEVDRFSPEFVYGSHLKSNEYPDGMPDFPIDSSGHVTIKFQSPQPGLMNRGINAARSAAQQVGEVVPKPGGVGIVTRIQSEIGSWADSVRLGRKNAPAAGVAIPVEENIALPREGKSYLIGRSSKSDITTVDNPFTRYVSREHARITNEGNNILTVTDLDSDNGTYILRSGGEPIRVVPNSPFPLEEGDIIRLGNPKSGYVEFDFAGGELNGPFYDRSLNIDIGGREGVGGGNGGIIPAEGAGQGGLGGIGGKVSNVVRESGERIGQAVSATREKILPSKITISEPEWNEKTIGIDGLQTEVDNLVSQAKGQGVPPGTKITISYFDDNLKLKTIHTKLETLATAIRNAIENNQFDAKFGALYIKFGNSSIELGSVSNLSDPQNIVWNVRNIPTEAELRYLITHSADLRKKVALAKDLGFIGIAVAIGGTVGAVLSATGLEIGTYYYVKPTTDKVPLKDPEAALRDVNNLPPNDYSCLGNQIAEVSATAGEVLKTLETCQSGCSSGMCQAKENAACQPGENLKVSDSSESCSLSCVDGVYARDFVQCDSIDLSGISTNRYREVVMRTLSILPDDFFPIKKFDKLSIYEVPLNSFSLNDIGDFSPEISWSKPQTVELAGIASLSGEHLLIGRDALSEGLYGKGISPVLIHELLHLWAYQSIKPLPEGVPYSLVASVATNILIGPPGSPLDYVSVTGCLAGGAGSAFHDQPVDISADNCQEDFAYAGTKYVLEACQLKNYSPERYEYFKSEVFRGKEYIPESGCPSQGG